MTGDHTVETADRDSMLNKIAIPISGFYSILTKFIECQQFTYNYCTIGWAHNLLCELRT